MEGQARPGDVKDDEEWLYKLDTSSRAPRTQLRTPLSRVARMAASVLTQAPLPIKSHATTKTVIPSTTTAKAAISMRSYIDDKARLAETAHLEYIRAPEQCSASGDS